MRAYHGHVGLGVAIPYGEGAPGDPTSDREDGRAGRNDPMGAAPGAGVPGPARPDVDDENRMMEQTMGEMRRMCEGAQRDARDG